MYIIHEGEILLKETYGTTTKERFYVKPPEQSNIVILEEGKLLGAYNWIARVFLPHGYPHTVSKDYAAYQIWDTAQAFCSTITGTLATQEVLRGVGVGDTSATPLAATITWVIKDGCGHLGRIFFACTHGTHLDAYSKKWRLYADVLNDAAMCIEISLPLFRNYTTTALCVSTAMKAIVGVAGGATRVALTQHHALCGNMADVAAKDSAQETAVNLVASIAALFLITVFGNSVTLFLFTMVLHITFNYLAVRAVCLRTLNEPRFLQVISSYVRREVIASPCEVNRHEPVVLYKVGNNHIDARLCGFRIKMGYSLKKITELNPKFSYLSNIRNTYADKNYLLYPNIGEREMYVLLHDKASAEDTLCAYFHAVLLAIVVCAINSEPLIIYENNDDIRPFGRICQTLQAADWSREPTVNVGISGFLYEPSVDLQLFLNSVVKKEWIRFKGGLIQIGWDISKHLLLSEEWRISCHTINPMERSAKEDDNESGILLPDISNPDFPDYPNYKVAGDKICAPFVIEPENSSRLDFEWLSDKSQKPSFISGVYDKSQRISFSDTKTDKDLHVTIKDLQVCTDKKESQSKKEDIKSVRVKIEDKNESVQVKRENVSTDKNELDQVKDEEGIQDKKETGQEKKKDSNKPLSDNSTSDPPKEKKSINTKE